MNILHLEASSGWGGQEMRILREAEGMRKRGHAVFFAVMKGGALAKEARKAGFTAYEVGFQRSGWLICLFQLLRIFRRHGIDLVNTHSSLDSWIGGIAARCAGKKILRTRHLSTASKPGWNSRILYGKLADFVVTTCSAAAEAIAKETGGSKFRSVPTGVEPEKVLVQLGGVGVFRKEWGIAEGDFLVGTACFMRSWKGIDDLLGAAHLLRERRKIKWVVIGGGHAERHLKKAKELNLDGIVFFTGHLSNPFPALASLDAFALLSTAHEGVSQAILQAAFLSKPLIATPTGGLGEVCLDGKTGIQVPIFSPEKVAQAVLRLQANPALCEQFGRGAYELVMKRFTFQETLNEMEQVYRSILKESNIV
jgi:glycosyltransferase involved in cell wall biosynthesis